MHWEYLSHVVDDSENLMFSHSGDDASSFLVQEESSSLFARVWSFCPSFLRARITNFSVDSLGNFNFEVWLGMSPVSWGSANSFSFVDVLFALTVRSPDWWVWLLPLESHHSRLCLVLVLTWHQSHCALWLERANLKKWLLEYVEKLVIFYTQRRWFHSSLRETSFGQKCHASWFLVSTYIDLDLEFQVDSVKQPIMSKSVSSWHMSHCWTSSFDYHFDHSFIVFRDVQLRLTLKKNVCWWVRDRLHSIGQPSVFLWHVGSWFLESRTAPVSLWLVCMGSKLSPAERKTSITVSQRSRAGNPSIRKPASREITSDSLELCETEVCFLHI